jgi:hypothetical protein
MTSRHAWAQDISSRCQVVTLKHGGFGHRPLLSEELVLVGFMSGFYWILLIYLAYGNLTKFGLSRVRFLANLVWSTIISVESSILSHSMPQNIFSLAHMSPVENLGKRTWGLKYPGRIFGP